MTNEELVEQIKAEHDVANNMLILYKQMKGAIYQIATRHAGLADMEDLMQEGYLVLYNAVCNYDSELGARFSTYAWKAIENHMLSYLKKDRKKKKAVSIDSMLSKYEEDLSLGDMIASDESVEGDVLDLMQQEQLEKAIWEAVDSLPSPQGEILRKRYKDEMTFKEIGEALGLNLKSAATQASRGISNLRKAPYRGKLLPFAKELL